MHKKILSLLAIIILLFNAGCSKEETVLETVKKEVKYNFELRDNPENFPYSIQIKSFGDADSADLFVKSFITKYNLTPFIVETDLKQRGMWYRVRLGLFESTFDAAKSAFHLFEEEIIEDYILTKEDEFINDPYSNFVFAALAGNNTGLYRYNIIKEKQEQLFNNRNETVVDFSYSDDYTTAFFITASEVGKIGLFPFIRNVKIYQFDPLTNKINHLKNVGNGLQVFTSWEKDKTFKVIFNNIDKTVASYVEQFTYIFNRSGRLANEEKKVFDLTTDGFPPYPTVSKMTSSPFSDSEIVITQTEIAFNFIVRNEKKETYVTTLPEELNHVYWSEDGKYLVFTTLDITLANETLYDDEPQTSNIFLFSLEENKILFQKDGSGMKNFLLRGSMLFFDDGFSESSVINCYNIKTNEFQEVLSIKGGCGLRNIPLIPDYDA